MAEIDEVQPPSSNPVDFDSLVGAFNFIIKKKLQNTDDMLPATVIAYDRAANLVQVQPMIKILTTGGQLLSRAPVASVPCLSLGGGGFTINFPLASGDTGWIKANDRDISLYLQSAYAESPPNTARLHSFSDGLFIPDVMSDYTIAVEDEANMVIQNTDGTVKIALWPAKIKIAAPEVEIVATTINSTAILNHVGAVNITGALGVTGDSTLTGNLDVSGTIENDSVDIGKTHKHSGVTVGAGNTGNPI